MTTQQEILSTLTTRQIVSALLHLEATTTRAGRTDEEKLTRIWLIDAIESRHPEVHPMMDEWADSDSTVSYVDALVAALPVEDRP